MTFIRHEHHWVSGPNSHNQPHKFVHSHELPGIYHRHPCTGPGSFGRSGKPTAKPLGEQLRFIPPEEGEDTFTVVMSEVYTVEHERNGQTREQFEADLAGFLAATRGEPVQQTGMTVNRIAETFGMKAIYERDTGRHWCGKTAEEHPKTKAGWRCPKAEEADRLYRAQLAERIAAELAEMGWVAS